MKKAILYINMILFIVSLFSCKKYLDKKPTVGLAIPKSLTEYQALLSRDNLLDNVVPELGDLGCDDYYIKDIHFGNLLSTPQNCYLWNSAIFEDASLGEDDWTLPYLSIYVANVVLEGLDDYEVTTSTEQIKWNTAYGHALFIRGMMHYFLEETFGQPFRLEGSNSELGIPLKLNASLEEMPRRSTVKIVFDNILSDLQSAAMLLPGSTATKNMPSKAAAYGMLARVYLTMHDYEKAGSSADSSLYYFSNLYDYNMVANPSTNNNPFSTFTTPNDLNFETLYPITKVSYNVFRQSTTNIDSNLYNSYNSDDLRKIIYFRPNSSQGTWYFKGNYSFATGRQFAGPATDEMYLIRAECRARAGNKQTALDDLNTLMVKRWNNTVTYPEITATDAEEALVKILMERRKELIFRGTRWFDLRRLNQDPRFAVTLKRVLNNEMHTLPPNDKRYTYPIPPKEIQLSGIEQNPR